VNNRANTKDGICHVVFSRYDEKGGGFVAKFEKDQAKLGKRQNSRELGRDKRKL